MKSHFENIKLAKSFVITGATSGLGLAIIKALRSCRANKTLVLVGRSEQSMTEIAKELDAPNLRFEYIEADLATESGIGKTQEQLLKLFDGTGPDVLINSAAVFSVNSVFKTHLESLKSDMTLNVIAPFALSQTCAHLMLKHGKRGHLIHIGSSSSYGSSPNTSAYCITKHALLGMSRSFQVELRNHGIRSVIVSPGSMQTPMGHKVPNQNFSTFIEPSELAKLIVSLSEQNSNLVLDEIRANRMVYE